MDLYDGDRLCAVQFLIGAVCTGCEGTLESWHLEAVGQLAGVGKGSVWCTSLGKGLSRQVGFNWSWQLLLVSSFSSAFLVAVVQDGQKNLLTQYTYHR